jgi:hypothetical protein
MAASVKNATVLYLYGISKTAKLPKHGVTGVDGLAPIETIDCATLVCWVSHVSRSEFADHLAEKMEDLDWLAEMSVRHQAAVGSIAEMNDVLPARFGTVFLDESSLKADIQSRKPTLREDFKRIHGNQEWGIKVVALPAAPPQLPTSTGGKGYLQAKSALLRSRRPAAADEDTARFAKELEAISEAVADGGKISGGRRDLQYQVSLLVKRTQRKKLEALLKRFSDQWQGTRRIECTGPWPPYSFVSRNSG